MAYWSTKPGETIYHVCRNCTKGNNIERANLKSDGPPPGRTLCDECARLQREGRCQPGVPTPAR